MKALFTAAIILLASGSFAQKVTEQTVTLEQQPTHTAIQGVVTSFEGRTCNLFITATIHGETIYLYPTNLPQEFNKDKLKIVFDYYELEENTYENCGYSASIHMSNVKIARPTKVK